MREFTDQLHPGLGATTLWGYHNTTPNGVDQKHLGGAIVAQSGTPVRVRWSNELPSTLGALGGKRR